MDALEFEFLIRCLLLLMDVIDERIIILGWLVCKQDETELDAFNFEQMVRGPIRAQHSTHATSGQRGGAESDHVLLSSHLFSGISMFRCYH
jgi:hypothetical protein